MLKWDVKVEILVILKHYFKLSLKATNTAHRIRNVEGNEIISDHSAKNWFKKFKSGDLYILK